MSKHSIRHYYYFTIALQSFVKICSDLCSFFFVSLSFVSYSCRGRGTWLLQMKALRKKGESRVSITSFLIIRFAGLFLFFEVHSSHNRETDSLCLLFERIIILRLRYFLFLVWKQRSFNGFSKVHNLAPCIFLEIKFDRSFIIYALYYNLWFNI